MPGFTVLYSYVQYKCIAASLRIDKIRINEETGENDEKGEDDKTGGKMRLVSLKLS